MHNKFAVIDNKVLITGSFNWTATAQEKNQENLLIIKDTSLIKDFSARFEMLWEKGRINETLGKGEVEE
jgi:phosphatidylserine/phosphatidylglycerophosphate/cardiolipin synthase-like enzyme